MNIDEKDYRELQSLQYSLYTQVTNHKEPPEFLVEAYETVTKALVTATCMVRLNKGVKDD